MQNCKSIVTMFYECYFFNQLLHCIGLACIIMSNDNVSFTRSKRFYKNIILHYTSSRKTSFHTKFQAQCLTVYLF